MGSMAISKINIAKTSKNFMGREMASGAGVRESKSNEDANMNQVQEETPEKSPRETLGGNPRRKPSGETLRRNSRGNPAGETLRGNPQE